MNKVASLPDAILRIVRDKGTEPPYSGEYDDFNELGTYLCRQCGLALFRSKSKFIASCGWASFDEELRDHITEVPDSDGRRTEIVCARCHAHQGHVFLNEGYTSKNVRHCINSLSLEFVHDPEILDSEEVILSGGCFWGVEYFFKQYPGVLKTEVGYTGGHIKNPSYEAVCRGNTEHYEATRVLFDPKKTNFETIAKYFFEIHDPTQTDGQGPDRGMQYLSAAFYYTEEQRKTLEHLIEVLKQKNYKVQTKLLPVTQFWKAEAYHQLYYEKTEKKPYCHVYKKRF